MVRPCTVPRQNKAPNRPCRRPRLAAQKITATSRNIGVTLWNQPPDCGYTLEPETCVRIAEIDNVVAIRYSVPRDTYVRLTRWQELLGQVGGPVRRPLLNLTEQEKAATRLAFEACGLKRG